MIIPNPKNFFQCMYPTLEEHEEEVFYDHPTEKGIKCNQIGILYYPEDKYTIYYRQSSDLMRENLSKDRTYRSIGNRERVVYECYTGKSWSGSHFIHLNCNHLDNTYDNLCVKTEIPKEVARSVASFKKKFVAASVERLMQLEAKAQQGGLEIEQLYQIIGLPNWLVIARKKHTAPKPEKVRSANWGGSRSKRTGQDTEDVLKLYYEGLTYMQIAYEMEWKSTYKVKRILADNNLSRKKVETISPNSGIS